MSALNDLVRKVKKAVGGEDSPRDSKPFEWEPAPAMPVTAPAVAREEGSRDAEPASGTPASWKRAAAEPSSVVGASIPADVADFATVYKGASVQVPSHGYGVDRVAGMLEHKGLAGLDKTVKASAVLAGLDAAGVSIDDVVHDGLLRYKALVAFEAAKELELHQVRARNQRRIEELQGASEEFQKEKNAEIDALTRESGAAAASLTRLKTRQRAEEERFYHTVALFVEPLPARVLPMTPKAAESPAPPPAAEPPELKLVTGGAGAPAESKPPAAEAAAEEKPASPSEPEVKS
jgi:hypothetical protein